MRIIAGKLKNKSIDTSRIDRHVTRPVSAIVRKSLFGMIGDVEYYEVLDLFCGSGILGFEALSRGARSVIFTDRERRNIEQLRRNIAALGVEEHTESYRADYRMAIKALKTRKKKFDIIFVDPPYKWVEKFDALHYIVSSSILKTKGRIVHNMEKHTSVGHEGMETVNEAVFGKTRFMILRRNNGSDLSGDI